MYVTDEGTIHGQLSTLGRAEAAFEREKAALYRSDGQQRYGDAEHAECLAALQATVDDAVSAAQEAADAIIDGQRTILLHEQEGDPLDHLTPSEQTAAAARQVFIKEDCETLLPADLLARCKVALAGTDRATAYLLYRYAGRRVRAADQAARDGQPATGGLSLEERQTLGQVVEELLAKVRGPQGEQKIAAAKALLDRARELRQRSIAVHDAAHGAAVDREMERLRATGSYGARR